VTERVKVLYIAGSGRTGSTILERILGQLDRLGSYGELRFIWERGCAQNWPCGCTKSFHECDFWQAVLAETFSNQPSDIEAVLRLNRGVDRTRYIPQILGLWRTTAFRQRFEAYTALLQKLYTAIARASGKPVVVDASKFDASGFILSQMPGVELHVLHLVRDSRAVAFSWQRRKMHRLGDGLEHPQLRRTPARAALEWLKLNLFGELMYWYAASYQRIRYEDFIRDPQGTAESILKQIGEADADLSFISSTSVKITAQTHTVAGNPNRLDYGEIPLRIDDEWRRRLSPGTFALVTLLTLPGLLRYGYPLRRRAGG
jgi:hypothetical protein